MLIDSLISPVTTLMSLGFLCMPLTNSQAASQSHSFRNNAASNFPEVQLAATHSGAEQDDVVAFPKSGEVNPELPTAKGTVLKGGTLKSQTWSLAASPYRIKGDLLLPRDQTLEVAAGVVVIFEGAYKFSVIGGRLLLRGTKDQPIRFTASQRDTGWYGILFCPDPSCTEEATRGELEATYTTFEYARANDKDGSFRYWRRGGALLLLNTARVSIKDSMFRYNYASEVGGAIEAIAIANQSLLELDNIRFFANEAGSGGALRLSHVNNRRWNKLSFIANRVRGYPDSYGGAIEAEDAINITLSRVIARGNSAESDQRKKGLGGAFYCYGPGLKLLDPIELRDNKPETSVGCGQDLP